MFMINAGPATSTPPVPYPFHDGCPGMGIDPRYDEARERGPVTDVVLPDGTPARLITRYGDIQEVLASSRLSRTQAEGIAYFPPLGRILLALDGEEHAAVRGPAARALTPRRVEAMRGLARDHAERLTESLFATEGEADFIAVFATPYALAIIADLIDIPAADREQFLSMARGMLSHSQEEVGAAMTGLTQYLFGHVLARKEAPGDDLVSAIVRDADGSLSDEDLMLLTLGLLVGGIESTASLTGQITLWLLTHPGRLAELRSEPELVESAITEFLRVLSSSSDAAMPRRALEDLTVGGTVIKAGDIVLASREAGNRDPRAFTDPEAVDFSRNPRSHLGYGWGPHRCIGANLATVSFEEAIRALLPRLPELRTDEQAVTWKRDSTSRGLQNFPVSVTAGA